MRGIAIKTLKTPGITFKSFVSLAIAFVLAAIALSSLGPIAISDNLAYANVTSPDSIANGSSLPAPVPYIPAGANVSFLRQGLMNSLPGTTVLPVIVTDQAVYSPDDHITILVYTNASNVSVFISDPAGRIFPVSQSAFNGTYYSVFSPSSPIVLGTYGISVTAITNNYTVQSNSRFTISVENTPVDHATINSAIADGSMVSGTTINTTSDRMAGDDGALQINNAILLTLGINDQPGTASLNSTCSPGDVLPITVVSNANMPIVYVIDPLGKNTTVPLANVGKHLFNGTYALNGTVTLGNYTVLAIDPDGTYQPVKSYFNLTMPGLAADQIKVQNVIYDPAQKYMIIKAKADKSRATMNIIVPRDYSGLSQILSQYHINKSISNTTMTSSDTPDGNNIHLSLSGKVDGSWYRISAPIPYGHNVDQVLRDDGSEIPYNSSMQDAANITGAGWYIDNNTVYIYDDPSAGYTVTTHLGNSVYGQQVVANKTLFLAANPDMYPSVKGDWSNGILSVLGLGGDATWTQTTPFAKDFTLCNNVTIWLYLSGGLNLITGLSVTVSYYSPDVGTRQLYTASGATLLSLGGGTYSVVDTLSNNITIKKGGYFIYNVHLSGVLGTVTVAQSAANLKFTKIDMYTPSYIHVDDLHVYDTGNNVINTVTVPQTVKLWANVSDPFGAYDIGDVNATVYYPNGSVYLGPYTMSKTSTGDSWANYAYNVAFPSPGMPDGNYNVIIWATESNGVKDGNTMVINVVSPYYVTVSKSVARTGANTYAVTIKLTNNQNMAFMNLYAYDFYPTGANGFSASGYSPGSPTIIPDTLYGVAGNVNKWGPYSLPGYGVQTITYNVIGSGNYRLSDLYVVGVDPP